MTKTAYAPEELTREAYKLLAKEKARVGGLNYAPYRGPTVSPMSSLTQKARTLQEQFAAKPAPYSNKIQTVLSRDNQGITPANIQELLGQLSGAQRGFAQGPLLDTLRREFKTAIEPRIGNFTGRAEADIGRYLPEAESNLQNLAKISGNLESARNREIVRTFQDLGADKEARREALLKNLQQFGSQRQAYNNMNIGANKAQFNTEANDPYRKLQMLQQALGTTGVNPDGPLHPDLAKSQTEQIAQALRAYGVDPSKPAAQWDTSRIKPVRYNGQLIADLPDEIRASGNVLERLEPKLRDNYTDQRKALTRSLLDNPSLSAMALNNLNPAMAGKISMLEQSAKEKMQKDLQALTNQYIKLGQYQSPQHFKAVEERAAELNKGVLEQRNRLLQESLREQLALGHEGEIDKIKQLGQIGAQSQKGYGDLLKNIRDTNKLGAEKFANNQAQNEDLYKNYQNENLWQWPHMRAASRAEGMVGGMGAQGAGDLFGGEGNKNISLDNLGNLNTRYSEIEKEQPVGGNAIFDQSTVRPEIQTELKARKQERAAKIGELNKLYLERLEQYKEAAGKRDRLYNDSDVNGVNAFSWSKSNPTRDFNSFLKHSLGVPSNTPDNIRIISNLNKNLPEYLEEVKRADYYWDQYNKYYQDMMRLKQQGVI